MMVSVGALSSLSKRLFCSLCLSLVHCSKTPLEAVHLLIEAHRLYESSLKAMALDHRLREEPMTLRAELTDDEASDEDQ
jgi:hypothetical protein